MVATGPSSSSSLNISVDISPVPDELRVTVPSGKELQSVFAHKSRYMEHQIFGFSVRDPDADVGLQHGVALVPESILVGSSDATISRAARLSISGGSGLKLLDRTGVMIFDA